MSKAPRRSLVPSASKTSGGFFHSIASRVLRAKTGVHAGRPFSFTYYITAESESSYSAVSIVHLVYSMCQIFSSSSPVLFLVPGACPAGTQTAPCRTNKNASRPSTYASFARCRDANQLTHAAVNTFSRVAAARGKRGEKVRMTKSEISMRTWRSFLSAAAQGAFVLIPEISLCDISYIISDPCAALACGKHTRGEIHRSRRALLSRPAHIFQ